MQILFLDILPETKHVIFSVLLFVNAESIICIKTVISHALSVFNDCASTSMKWLSLHARQVKYLPLIFTQFFTFSQMIGMTHYLCYVYVKVSQQASLASMNAYCSYGSHKTSSPLILSHKFGDDGCHRLI